MDAEHVELDEGDADGPDDGRYPAEAPPLLDDDTFRFAAFGTAIAVGPPVFLSDPSLRRLWVALGAAAGAAIVVGFVARSMVLG